MPQIIVVNQSGEETSVEASEGRTLMEVIRDNGFDELLALCGGCCSCATCHVYVDEDHVGELQPMNADEDALLDTSDHRAENSRLGCQLVLGDAHDGMRVTIAPDD